MTDTTYILPDPEQQKPFDAWAAVARPGSVEKGPALLTLTLEQAVRKGSSERLICDLANTIQRGVPTYEQSRICSEELLEQTRVFAPMGAVAAMIPEELQSVPLENEVRVALIDRIILGMRESTALLEVERDA